MKNIKYIIIFTIIFALIVFVFAAKNKKKFDLNTNIGKYNLADIDIERHYMDYLKEYIYPIKLRNFIDNDFVPTSLLSQDSTGKDVIDLMKETGYEIVFNKLFDTNSIISDEYPVSENFKKKYNVNLLDYYNLKHSNKCEIDCIINCFNSDLIVEIYDEFQNTEPTYIKTHHFQYVLDEDGNVDDVIFDYTE